MRDVRVDWVAAWGVWRGSGDETRHERVELRGRAHERRWGWGVWEGVGQKGAVVCAVAVVGMRG